MDNPKDLVNEVMIVQYYLIFAGHVGAFIMATVWSYSAMALPSLRMDNQMRSHISPVIEDWIASITLLAAALGTIPSGYTAHKYGLKRSLQIIAAPLLIGWIMIASAQNMFMLLLGRFITGFCATGVGVACVVVAELTPTHKRYKLSMAFELMFSTGVLFSYVTGIFLSWRFQAASCAVVTLLWLSFLFIIPKSSRSLYEKGDFTKAYNVLEWVQQTKEVKEDESTESVLQTSQEADQNSDENSLTQFLTLSLWKPILTVVCLQFFQQLSGFVPILFYASDIFKLTGANAVHADLYVMLLGGVNVGATFVACLCMGNTSRRLMLIVSEAGLTFAMTILGVFLYLRDSISVQALQTWDWFPCLCLVLYISAYNFGVGPIPWIISGEILHSSKRVFSHGVIIILTRVFGFLAMFYFKLTVIAFGQKGVFLGFAFICFSGLLFSYFVVPQSKRKTFKTTETKSQKLCSKYSCGELAPMNVNETEEEP